MGLVRRRVSRLALALALLAGCSGEEPRLDRLLAAPSVSFETEGGEAPVVPDLFHGRVGMRWLEVDAACTEGGGRLEVAGSDVYRCEGLTSPFRMQSSSLAETYVFDDEQRCDAAYYEIRLPAQGPIRYQTRRYTPVEATRLMMTWVVDAVEDFVALEKKSSTRYESAAKWVRVLREGTIVVVEVGLRPPTRSSHRR